MSEQSAPIPQYPVEDRIPTDSEIAKLRDLADELRVAELEVETATEALKKAQERRRDIAEVQLPELMDDLGMETFTTTDGRKVSVKVSVHASIPKTRLPEAMDWLVARNYGGLIKSTVTVNFGRDEADEAKDLVADLEEDGLAPKLAEGVHPSTLKSWARERLEAGDEIDVDLFGVFRRREVMVET